MCRLVRGVVLAVIVVASLGCGGGLSEKEVREIVVESSVAIQADYRAEIKRGDDANYEEERAVRQEEVLGWLEESKEEIEGWLEETSVEIEEMLQEDWALRLEERALRHQHVDAICMLDYKVVTLSVALEALILYLAGGELTLEEIADVFIEGVPIDEWDFSWQHNSVCGLTPEGHLYLLPIATQ